MDQDASDQNTKGQTKADFNENGLTCDASAAAGAWAVEVPAAGAFGAGPASESC